MQEDIKTFYTDDMALAAYLVMRGHEVTGMQSERRMTGTGNKPFDQISWGFDRDTAFDSEVMEVLGNSSEVTLNLYKFMGALAQVRELMFDYRRDPQLFGEG